MPNLNKNETIRKKLKNAQKSPVRTYIALTSGENGFFKFLLYELLTSFLGPIPGSAGFFLRQKFYPFLFRKSGKNPIIGRNVVFRHPGNIEIGDYVTIDDNSLIDAHGAGQDGIVLKDQVIINRNCLLQAKSGPIRIGCRTSIGSYTIITSIEGVEIGKEVIIAGRCYFNSGFYNYNQPNTSVVDQVAYAKGPIKIGNNCYIRAGAMVVEGVEIGDEVTIGPGAIIENDLPSRSITRATPANILTNRKK